MHSRTKRFVPGLIVLTALLLPILASRTALASCGAEFCSANTSLEAQGAGEVLETSIDLRYETSLQNQSWAGDRAVNFREVPRADHDEIKTSNQNLIATAEIALSRHWGLTVQLPVVLNRNHDHVDNEEAEQRHWDFSGMGDMRLLGRYQFALDRDNRRVAGARFGLKLPTGRFRERNAQGNLAERSLQLGTGTTDVVLGGYYSETLARGTASWFAAAAWQQPLNSREAYRPGERITIDAGYRRLLAGRLTGVIQANLLIRGRDGETRGEPLTTGGTFMFLSPGLSYAVSGNVLVYGFVQVPVYRHVNGVQLTSNAAVITGATWRL